MRINKILQHPKYKRYLEQIEEYEWDREFCRHNMAHFLDVCRLGQILWMTEEKNEDFKTTKEMIYAAGLLHDIGRWQEYESGIRHEKASAVLAVEILQECGFEEDEVKQICEAVCNHRNSGIREERSLSGILYRADKMSRPCFACKKEEDCSWKKEKKNLILIY